MLGTFFPVESYGRRVRVYAQSSDRDNAGPLEVPDLKRILSGPEFEPGENRRVTSRAE